ncbi:hypothetical protein [Limnohabitans sp. Rim8]|uniref:hypothetical protein n=1 Tax=Limnohabitans sp. Rim8 TaxID=1100718 RepID=UPI0025FE31A8|nr:hypothetical protein [Limnohabitans sp. Rim8]
MKLQRALRNKTEALDTLNADVYVIQECENPGLSTSKFQEWASDYLWVGTSKHKGLGIFPKKGNTVQACQWHGTFSHSGVINSNPSSLWSTDALKLFLPFILNDKYQVLGVWIKADHAEVFSYIGQLWKYLQIHRDQLKRSDTLLLGDFNSNRIWDKPERWWNHSDVIEELAAINLESLYHQKSMIQLPPSLLQPLDAHRLRGAQFLREEAHAQLFQ